MNYKSILTQLYFVLIYADGQANEYERATGNNLVQIEKLDEAEFKVQLELLKSKNPATIMSDCINAIKLLDRRKQIRIVAWLCVVANGDGFMDKMEWQMIYNIYHKELGLPLEEIFKVQKELNRLPRIHSSSNNPIQSVA